MLKKILLVLILISSGAMTINAQEENDYEDSYCSNTSLDLGFANSGLSFGNSK